MKKIMKLSLWALPVGFALILIAGVWSGFSVQRIQRDFENIGQKKYETKVASFDSNSISTVNVDINDFKVIIKTHADDTKVTVDYFESDVDIFTAKNSDGILSVARTPGSEPNNFLCFFRCVTKPHTITVSVPENSRYAYDLRADNAAVVFENTKQLQTKSITVASSNSSVRLQRIDAAGTVRLESDNGSIKLHDITASGALTLQSSNASNQLVAVTAPVIDSRTDNGGAQLEAVVSKDLVVHASNATIMLARIAADRATLVSDNGGVKGSIVGIRDDYTTKIGSDNGGIRVDDTSYGGSYITDNTNLAKKLSITSSNSQVHITFVK